MQKEVYVVNIEYVSSNLYGEGYNTRVFDSEDKAIEFIQKEIFEIYDYGPDLNMDDYTEDELKSMVDIPSRTKILTEAKKGPGLLCTDAAHNLTIYSLKEAIFN